MCVCVLFCFCFFVLLFFSYYGFNLFCAQEKASTIIMTSAAGGLLIALSTELAFGDDFAVDNSMVIAVGRIFQMR